jgi:hypothetical protein
MDPGLNQRWLVQHEDLVLLESTKARNMSEGSTLSDFITYSSEKFPADRYMLVLWDHGGGTVDGYAYDERFDNQAMMSLSELDGALAEAGVMFDMIGFDCCLMSTVEIAFMAEKYADYMVASQRVEPGNGWFYTPWITALSRNTSIPSEDLCKVIVDSFIEECRDGYYSHELTLSVTDLTYIPDLFDTMYDFFSGSQTDLVDSGMFVSMSKALADSRAIQDKYDLVDLAYLLESMGGSEELLDKFKQCIIYNGATIKDHNGLCMYFPYTDLGQVSEALDVCERIGIDKAYQGFIASYANTMLGGQAYNDGGSGGLFDGGDFDLSGWMGQDWVDEDAWTGLSGFFADNSYYDPMLPINEVDGEYVLTLSEEEWDLMTYAELMVFVDDGEGYIDLGRDCKYDFDGTNLSITFDNTWVALDGNLVCFFNTDYIVEGDCDEEGNYDYWCNYGVVPILFEDKEAELVLMWDSDNPYGYVAGWRYTYLGGGSQKGLFELWDGMSFDFLCDYYTYDNEYDDQYLFGSMTVNGPVEVSYEDVGDDDCLVYYALYDIFQNTYWTDPLVFSLDYEEESFNALEGFLP